MLPRNHSMLARIVFTLLMVALATLLRFVLAPFLGHGVPFILYFPIVVVCAWYGGLKQGLLATALSSLVSWFLFIPLEETFPMAFAQLSVFLTSSALICLLAENLHEAKRSTEESEARERERREELRVMLASIGDAVIATNTQGDISFLNGVAEALTGWNQEEAVGKRLEDVFRIINEATRQPVENPVTRVLEQQQIVSLANHTVLIAKDGTERPIDDTAAPILDQGGKALGAVLIFRDLTQRRKDEDRRKEAEARFKIMADSAPVLVWMSGTDKGCEYFNQGWLKFTGQSLERELGNGWTEGIHPDDLEARLQVYTTSFDARRPFELEYRLRRFDGEYRWVLDTAIPRYTPDGIFAGYIGSCLDITERKQAEQEREALLARAEAECARAEEASRLKDEFLATVSHELRTPLNAILGWARILVRENLDAETISRAIKTIERNAKSQAQLIEDILDVSRIITGKLRLDAQAIDLVAVIQSALDSVRPAADAKEIRIQSTLELDTGPIFGDLARLQQVVWNLLSNAIKFTPQGGQVHIGLKRIGSHAEIVVADTGQGIKQEFLPHVFDRFRQADGSTTREHTGLGLGLAIVRHLVELHGGTVSAASPGVAQGAVFTVRLPLMALDRDEMGEPVGSLQQPERMDVQVSEKFRTLEGIRVLVVDDDLDSLSLLQELLQRSGAEVKTSASAGDALKNLREWKPSVIISDIGMPGEDGYAFIKKVRTLEAGNGRQIPALALTAYARSEDRLKAFSSGYQMHLPKPVEPMELIVVVASLADRNKGQ